MANYNKGQVLGWWYTTKVVLNSEPELSERMYPVLYVEEKWYNELIRGTKTIEGRLNIKEIYKTLSVGDFINFVDQNNSKSSSVFRIVNVKTYESIESYLNNEGLSTTLPGVNSLQDGIEIYRQFYSEENEIKYGIICFHVERVGEEKPKSATELIKQLNKRMLKLKGSLVSEDGSKVDYSKAKSLPIYKEYCDMTSALRSIDLASLGQTERKAFYINLYNCLTIHSIIEGLLKPPGGFLSRLQLYASAAYVINGIPFSLNDIENGLLRCNSAAPAPFANKPFPDARDKRLKYCVSEIDPRIHFALNCGAVSCPPIAFYSDNEEKLDAQLKLAATGFIESTTSYDTSKKVVKLSKIFDWYKNDFGGSKSSVLAWIKALSPDVINADIANVKVAFDDYNWALNS